MSFLIALTDQYGPRQFVPGSHYAGRKPNDLENPIFAGEIPKSLLMKAGDLY